MLAPALLLAAATASGGDATSVDADAAMTALQDFCLAAEPEFRNAPALLMRAGWVDINEQARQVAEGRNLIPMWRPHAGDVTFDLILVSGVSLRSVSEPHTTCLVTSSHLTLTELRAAAEVRLGSPDQSAEGTRWSVPGQPNRYIELSRNLAGQGNNGLVVVELNLEG